MPVVDFVTGVRTNALAHDEVLRAIEIPQASLEARHGFRRIARSPLGRTGTLVTAVAGPEFTIGISGGTVRPHALSFDERPSERALLEAIGTIDDWYDDAHGSPDWREAMSTRFALELLEELA